MTQNHHGVVAENYGPRADAYVSSAVHAGGADLDQIELFLRGRSNARALDLGCGGGHVSYRAAPHVAEVVAVDLTPEMLEVVARTAAERGLTNIATRQAPAEQLPFEDGRFDIVLCRFTAHHWRDFEAGLREARRVLAPGGIAVFIDCVAPAAAVLDTHLQVVEVLDAFGVPAIFAGNARAAPGGGYALSTDLEAMNAIVRSLLGSEASTLQ